MAVLAEHRRRRPRGRERRHDARTDKQQLACYGILLLAAVLLFAWLVASSLVLVRRAHRPR